MIKTIRYILIVVLLTIGIGCKDDNCLIKYTHFNENEAPFICIDSYKGGCTYLFHGQFWLNNKNFFSGGEIIVKDDAFHLRIDSIDAQMVRFFDFSKRTDDEYDIKFDLRNASFSVKVKVDTIVKTKDYLDAFVFRIQKGWFNQDVSGDLVYFVSKGNGVLGSYISITEAGADWVIAPKGDILKNYMDYSKKEFGKIE